MQAKTLKLMIGLVLVLFVFFSILISQLCQPSQNNPVVAAVSNALSAPNPVQSSAKPDPLSWDPVLRQLLSFLSKACPR